MSIFGQVSEIYEACVSEIIRPPRDLYEYVDLGQEHIVYEGERYHREDFSLPSQRPGGGTLQCSHYGLVPRSEQTAEEVRELGPQTTRIGVGYRKAGTGERRPVIIFLHANASSRCEALGVLPTVLSAGADLFSFDFCGSGRSDGEYVSLGHFEKEDLATVVAYLKRTVGVATIGLWGHSMGAVSALLHADRDSSIAGMILDSPFKDLRTLSMEVCERASVPSWLASTALAFVKMSVYSRAGFSIDELTPISHVGKTYIPAIFVAGDQDEFIRDHHGRALEEAYVGFSEFVIVKGDHNSDRPQWFLDKAGDFWRNVL